MGEGAGRGPYGLRVPDQQGDNLGPPEYVPGLLVFIWHCYWEHQYLYVKCVSQLETKQHEKCNETHVYIYICMYFQIFFLKSNLSAWSDFISIWFILSNDFFYLEDYFKKYIEKCKVCLRIMTDFIYITHSYFICC